MKSIPQVQSAIRAAFAARDEQALECVLDWIPQAVSPGAQKRIEQLVGERKDERRQLLEETAYFECVVHMMIPMLPKAAVARVLEAAKEFPQQITPGGNHVSVQSEIRSHHYAQAQSADGAGAAGRQGPARRDGEAAQRFTAHQQTREVIHGR